MARLQVEEDLSFQQREWRLERVGWGALVVFVLAALGGLFGDGPLSRAHASAGRSLDVEYERFVRRSSQTELRVALDAPTRGEAALWLDHRFLRQIELTAIQPAPARIEHRGTRVAYVYAVSRPTSLLVSFQYEPRESGRLDTRVGTADDVFVTIRQWAFF